jgi:toxin YoeB
VIVGFPRQANREYRRWQRRDKRIAAKIDELLLDIERDPFSGLGKPELLKGSFSGR